MNKRIWVIITAVLVTLLPAKVKYIMTIIYRYGNTMGDNREEAYLQNPLSKTSRLLKLLPNGADILRHKFTVNFSATFHFCKLSYSGQGSTLVKSRRLTCKILFQRDTLPMLLPIVRLILVCKAMDLAHCGGKRS